MAKWKQNYNPDIVIKKLEKIKRVDSNGSIHFSGTFDEYRVLVDSMIDMDDTIPQIEKSKMIVRALNGNASITAKRLLSKICKLESEYQKQEAIRYYLLTTISSSGRIQIPRVAINGGSITFNPKLNKKFYDNYFEIVDYAKNNYYSKLPEKYSFVRISLLSRSPNEAADNSLDSINLFRAIWNLFNNLRIISILVASVKGIDSH